MESDDIVLYADDLALNTSYRQPVAPCCGAKLKIVTLQQEPFISGHTRLNVNRQGPSGQIKEKRQFYEQVI